MPASFLRRGASRRVRAGEGGAEERVTEEGEGIVACSGKFMNPYVRASPVPFEEGLSEGWEEGSNKERNPIVPAPPLGLFLVVLLVVGREEEDV